MKEFLRIREAEPLPPRLRGGVVAIGNFDGVHRGHQAVLDAALDLASQKGRPALVLTFEPHPVSVFRPEPPLFRLTPAPLKAGIVDALGFDAIVEQPFTKAFAAHAPADFVAEVLEERLGAADVVVGHDFHYGKDRKGTPQTLADSGRSGGFDLAIVDSFCDEGGATISSTRIRALLCEGDVAEAGGLLGYRYLVRAPVGEGRKLGRTLGYPTANMALPPETPLRHGIYAVRLRRADGSLHDGVASFGRRPTVDEDGPPLLETFVFDFSGDLYGETCCVSFFGFLRGEEKFPDLDALTAQMRRDEAEARALLSKVEPLTPLDRWLTFDHS